MLWKSVLHKFLNTKYTEERNRLVLQVFFASTYPIWKSFGQIAAPLSVIDKCARESSRFAFKWILSEVFKLIYHWKPVQLAFFVPFLILTLILLLISIHRKMANSAIRIFPSGFTKTWSITDATPPLKNPHKFKKKTAEIITFGWWGTGPISQGSNPDLFGCVQFREKSTAISAS